MPRTGQAPGLHSTLGPAVRTAHVAHMAKGEGAMLGLVCLCGFAPRNSRESRTRRRGPEQLRRFGRLAFRSVFRLAAAAAASATAPDILKRYEPGWHGLSLSLDCDEASST